MFCLKIISFLDRGDWRSFIRACTCREMSALKNSLRAHK